MIRQLRRFEKGGLPPDRPRLKYLRIGWKLACSIIDRMEADGIVTPPDVTGRRSLTKEPTQ